MPALIQRTFASGEIAPDLYGRSDLAKYQTALKTCRNFIVRKYGGIANRPGTYYTSEARYSDKLALIRPFVFSTDQTYALEFGDQYMRVFRNGLQLTDSTKTITGATAANPVVITAVAHGFSNGNEVSIASAGGMWQINNRNFLVANAAANTFELTYLDGTPVNGTTFTAYTSGGTASRVYQITTPYLEADLDSLNFSQSGDVITITSQSYAVRELSRTGHTSWSLATPTFAPSNAAPASPSAVNGTAGTTVWRYKVSTVATDTLEESLPTAMFSCTGGTPTLAAPNTMSWTAAAGALEYYVYREVLPGNGVYGYIGTAATTSFNDPYITTNAGETPVMANNPFNATGDYPSTSAYFQQRKCFAGTLNNPEEAWLSRAGQYNNLTTSSPMQDSDAINFTIVGSQVNSIRHMVDLGGFIILTSGAEWLAAGNADGAVTPTAINLVPQSYNGCAEIQPIVINNSALYVQARGSFIRNITYNRQTGYENKDVSLYSPHLFENYSIVDWCYQQIPNSVVWAVRDDGIMVALTYLPEEQVYGWHRHDTDGVIESVCSIPEGRQDTTYMIVARNINGAVKRYIERSMPREETNIEDAFFVDCGLSYDGRNTNSSHTMTLSGGTTWSYTEDLTLTSSTAYFTSGMVGDAIVLNIGDVSVKCQIIGYTSGTQVTVNTNKDVPVAFRSVAIAVWSRAASGFYGLWHLEGKTVSILADGNVEAQQVVTGGTIAMQEPYSVVHAGLPYDCDIVTLPVDLPQATDSVANKKKLATHVDIYVKASRGIFAGSDLDHLFEWPQRALENYGQPTDLYTGIVEIPIGSTWNNTGQIALRQSDPLPISIIALTTVGQIGG